MIKTVTILPSKLLGTKDKENTVAKMIFSKFLFERSFDSELARAVNS